MRASGIPALRTMAAALLFVALGLVSISASSQPRTPTPGAEADDVENGRERAEFHFARMIYRDLPSYGGFRGRGRGWWRQDWPAAD